MNDVTRSCTEAADAELQPAETLASEYVRRGGVKRSRASKWRVIVLVGIHLFIVGHIIHWRIAGRTLSPLEPSEGMYSVRDGVINAGAILLVVSILSTLLFGRWFCGWACHMIAVQDACAWILKKLGMRPRPVRSRLLFLVPLGAGLFLFGWPAAWRVINDFPPPPVGLELEKEGFWDTFPGIGLTLLTFALCGFGIVWLLGSKGFCKYACPYGGFFGLVDKLSPWRIRVSDACKGCGHCSAVCTSHVLVHQEVRDYGTVVDSGCMKCADCISVCPEDALSFSLGKPALFTKARVKKPKKRSWPYSWGEEIALLLVFLGTMVLFRGLPNVDPQHPSWARPLYDIPMLFSLGISAMVAFALVTAFRLFRRESLHFQRWQLKSEGKFTGHGKRALVAALLLLLFLGHSAIYQRSVWKGERMWRATEIAPAGAAFNPDRSWYAALSDGDRKTLDAVLKDGEESFAFAQSIALSSVSDPLHFRRRAWFALLRGEPSKAERFLELARDAIEESPPLFKDLGRVLNPLLAELARVQLLMGRQAQALQSIERGIELDPRDTALREQRLRLLIGARRFDEALAELEAMEGIHGASVQQSTLRAEILVAKGETAKGLKLLQTLVDANPDAPLPAVSLGRALRGSDPVRARSLIVRASELAPQDLRLQQEAAEICLATEDLKTAEAVLRRAVAHPNSVPWFRLALARLLRLTGREEEAKSFEAPPR